MAITFDGQNDRVTTSSQALNLPTNVAGSLSVGGLNVGVGGTIVVGTGGTTLSLTNSGNLTVAGQIVCSAVSRNLNATGGNTITRFGEKRLHIFTSPGTFQVLSGSRHRHGCRWSMDRWRQRQKIAIIRNSPRRNTSKMAGSKTTRYAIES